MKLACTSDFILPEGTDLGLAFHKAAHLGLKGLALALTPNSPMEAGSFAMGDLGFMKEAREHGLAVPCLYGLPVSALEPEAEIGYLKKAVCLAHAMGSELVTVKIGFKTGERPIEAAREILDEVTDFSEDLDVCIGVEPDLDSALPDLAKTLDFIDSIGHRHIGLVYNTALHRFSDEKMPINAAEVIKSYLLMVVLGEEAEGNSAAASQALLLLHKAGFNDFVLLHSQGGRALELSRSEEKVRGLVRYFEELSKEERFQKC